MALTTTADPPAPEPPCVNSLQDLQIIESWDPEADKFMYCTFIHVTPEDHVYFGESTKTRKELTLSDCLSTLKHVNDDEIFPKIPEEITFTIASDSLNDVPAYTKRPGLMSYEIRAGTEETAKEVMSEALIMEQVSKLRHPNIVEYYGCRVRRGRITGIMMENLEWTLYQYSLRPAFEQLDKVRFIEALESAVESLHSIGLAHNDINPHNIMIKDGMPVLIDFGGCQPFGKQVTSHGTPGWYEEIFWTSEKKHDTYSMTKLRQWIQNMV